MILHHFNEKIRINDLWLTNMIIDCYLVVLRKKNPKISCCSELFYTKLVADGQK